MSQHDFNIANQTAAPARADINSALTALASLSSGATAPSTTVANMLWYDTANDTLNIRNEADSGWISIGYVEQSSGEFALFDNAKVVNSSGTQTGIIGDQATSAWEAGTSTTESLVSPAKVAAAIEALTPEPIGVGQTWQDVSGSRSGAVSYQNTTGKPILVNAMYQGTSGDWQVSTDNTTWVKVGTRDGSSWQNVSFIVPDTHYYRLNIVRTIDFWSELR